ncbi:MAG: hypothetical protein EOO45_13480 [Flavobacterium sp.]|nr:MAG: hypothetical protein EOO45_13480 [Flavobacterium sp.]
MIITLSNLKGGCGCTTLSLLLAHYFSQKKKQVFLIDLTYDGSLEVLYSKSLLLHERLPFDFFTSDLHKVEFLIDKLKGEKDAIILLDLPKVFANQQLMRIMTFVEIFIVPFQYGFISTIATTRFAILSAKISPMSTSIFLPNMVLPGDFNDDFIEQQKSLRSLGHLSSAISLHPALIELRSMLLPPSCLYEIAISFDLLYSKYLEPKR